MSLEKLSCVNFLGEYTLVHKDEKNITLVHTPSGPSQASSTSHSQPTASPTSGNWPKSYHSESPTNPPQNQPLTDPCNPSKILERLVLNNITPHINLLPSQHGFRSQHSTSTYSQKEQNIVITKADKGGKVVILNSNDYCSKLEDILSDHSTYERLNKEPLKAWQQQYNRDLKRILKDHSSPFITLHVWII